jgi:hypothetical protein
VGFQHEHPYIPAYVIRRETGEWVSPFILVTFYLGGYWGRARVAGFAGCAMPAVHLAGSGSGDCGGGDSAYFGVLLQAPGAVFAFLREGQPSVGCRGTTLIMDTKKRAP